MLPSRESCRIAPAGLVLWFFLFFLLLTGWNPATTTAGESKPTGGSPAPARTVPASRPTLALEDTLRPLVAEPLPEILVTAPRLSLDEILRRVAEGEAHRDSLIQDQAYTMYVRVVGRDSRKDPVEKNEPYFESAQRIYQERPGKQRTVLLKQWSRPGKEKPGEETRDDAGDRQGRGSVEVRMGAGSDRSGRDSTGSGKNGSSVQVNFDDDMSEQFISFAFDPSMRSRFRFRIEDRKLVGDQVIYVLQFTPRSSVELLPTGRVWVNTNDFVILREEFSFGNRSPAPLFLESLDSCVLERTRIDRQYWVVSRILARVTINGALHWMGKVAGEKVPRVMDLAIARSDWIINGDIPDSLFTPGKAR